MLNLLNTEDLGLANFYYHRSKPAMSELPTLSASMYKLFWLRGNAALKNEFSKRLCEIFNAS